MSASGGGGGGRGGGEVGDRGGVDIRHGAAGWYGVVVLMLHSDDVIDAAGGGCGRRLAGTRRALSGSTDRSSARSRCWFSIAITARSCSIMNISRRSLSLISSRLRYFSGLSSSSSSVSEPLACELSSSSSSPSLSASSLTFLPVDIRMPCTVPASASSVVDPRLLCVTWPIRRSSASSLAHSSATAAVSSSTISTARRARSASCATSACIHHRHRQCQSNSNHDFCTYTHRMPKIESEATRK